ncbi:MAG: glycosyltransferase [Nanoarchaeota archaeon]
MKRVSIVMPSYLEEKRIGKTLRVFSDFFERASKERGFLYELLIVINGPRDGTEKIIKEAQKKNRNIKYLDFERGGKGFAVMEGFKDALKRDNDLIGFVDADLATGPDQFFRLIESIGSADGAIANRYSKRSKIIPAFSFRRNIVSKVFNLMVRSLFLMNYRDTQCGAKLFSRRAIEMLVKSAGMTEWAFDVELLCLMSNRGYRIAQVPTVWRDIGGGTIKIGKISLQMMFSIVQLRIKKSLFRKLLRPLKPIVNPVWESLK